MSTLSPAPATPRTSGKAGNFRCDICGYSEQFGNEATGEGPGLRKVYWNKLHGEHQCTSCSSSIEEVKTDFALKDNKNEEELVEDRKD